MVCMYVHTYVCVAAAVLIYTIVIGATAEIETQEIVLYWILNVVQNQIA